MFIHLPVHPLHDVHSTEHPKDVGICSIASGQQAGRWTVRAYAWPIQIDEDREQHARFIIKLDLIVYLQKRVNLLLLHNIVFNHPLVQHDPVER